MNHRPRKRFGQNFLVDRHIVQRLQDAIKPQGGDHVVEIGPGQGALTDTLIGQCSRLDVVEIDRDLATELEQRYPRQSGFRIYREDALEFDYTGLCQSSEKLRVVGNLPYNISTPLLFHLLKFKPCIADMHFMLQKEVVVRLGSAPGSKTYGRLSVMAQYHCDIQPLFDVPPQAFWPQPKVMSAIVRLIPRQAAVAANNEAFLARVVSTCFQQRRKTLRNSLKNLKVDAERVDCVDLGRRPESLSVVEFVHLSNQLDVQS